MFVFALQAIHPIEVFRLIFCLSEVKDASLSGTPKTILFIVFDSQGTQIRQSQNTGP